MTAVSIEPRIRQLLLAGQERTAADLVIREFGPSIYGLFVNQFPKRPELAEEAFSCFAENLVRGISSYRGEASVRTWTYILARNAAVSVARDGWRRLGRRLETTEFDQLAQEARTRSAIRLERQVDALAPLRHALDPDDQLLLTLRLDEELSWDEVALVLSAGGEPVAAPSIRKRFQRLKATLGEEARRLGLLE